MNTFLFTEGDSTIKYLFSGHSKINELLSMLLSRQRDTKGERRINSQYELRSQRV